MAVAKMRLVNIIGHIRSLDAIVGICGKCGVFQPEDAIKFYPDLTDFIAAEEENPYTLPMTRLETAVLRMGGSLDAVPGDTILEDAELFRAVEEFTSRCSALTAAQSELASELESQTKDKEQFEHFIGLDVDLEAIIHCETIKVRFGRLPKENYEKLQIYNDNPFVMFFPSKTVSDPEYYWGVYFAPKEYSKEVDRIFSSLYFERMRIPDAIGTPEEIIERLQAQQVATRDRLRDVKAELAALWAGEKERCGRVYQQLRRLDYFFRIRRYAVRYKEDYLLLIGWIPTRNEKAFKAALDEIEGIEYNVHKAEHVPEHSPPVKLNNLGPVKPFEFFVDMYGLPRYNEFDPTFFVAVTYTLLFGIMFGDAGQGLLVAGIGWLMWRFKRMPIGQVLVPCGLSATVFGVVFGSVFGFENALNWFYVGILGMPDKPIRVMDTDKVVGIIVASVVLGAVLTLIAVCINIYASFKRRDPENAWFGPNGVAGLVFLSAVFVGAGAPFGLGKSVLGPGYVLLFLVLPAVLIYLREPLGRLVKGNANWKPEKWGEFLTQNFFELFEVMLSYLSNIVSFLRVSAFVLIHAGMMMAVFKVAELFGPTGFAVTVVVGNLLVTGMEALLVAIQVLRLEFYEMFSRYYVGDGQAFSPLRHEEHRGH